MKTVLFFIVLTICVLTSTFAFAFADIIYSAQTSFNPAFMMCVGFCLLGLAKIGRKIV
ncbi:hypothetical protein [uncultured Desulfobacter sp.]|uniref:hypothetical protein n=1 Tax=uncultured Desulfobacter sp. TaxID=240139 RepID=UPI0029C96D78|nr:hypothetical protein [uncultured Desulfobacter sp.]